MHLPALCLLPLIVASLFAGEPVAGKPLPAGADDAHLQRAWVQKRLAWNRATLVEAYRVGGAHSPKWDAGAISFLERCALYFSDNAAGVDLVQLDKDGWELAVQMCVDPVVRDNVETIRSLTHPGIQNCSMHEQAWGWFAAHPYSSPRRAFCAIHSLTGEYDSVPEGNLDHKYVTKETRERIACFKAHALESIVTQISDPVYVGYERLLFEHLDGGSMPTTEIAEERDVALQAAIAKPGVNPWFAAVWTGRREIDLAWRSRGHGFADTVTKAGEKGFREHLALARTALARAMAANPRDPVSRAMMITVEMATGGDVRRWFDASVAEEFDYLTAYDNLALALLPRWGGSHQRMLAVGEECIATKRYDTQVPWQYFEIFKTIIHYDFGDDPRPAAAALGVQKHFHEMFAGYIAEAERQHATARADHLRSLGVVADYVAGDIAEAQRGMARLGKAMDRTAFEDFNLNSGRAAWEINRFGQTVP